MKVAKLLALAIIASPSAYASDVPISATALSQVAEEVTPAVVNITTRRNHSDEDDPMMREFFGQNRPRMTPEAAGSGVVVSSDGYVVTNNHVISGADEIKVTLSDRREYSAKLIGADKPSDIALLKIGAKSLRFLKLGDSSKLRLGEIVLAIGNPFGVGQTVTMGIVSAKGRANVGLVEYEDFIQTDASINPGNSGGALVNMLGELVGINTAILSKSGGAQGIGFSVPSRMVSPILEQIRNHGRVRRGYLGVSIQDLTPEFQSSLKLGELTGVVVADVVDAPALGKLEPYDVIVAVDGQPTFTVAQLRNQVALTLPGSKTKLSIVREGKSKDVTLVLREKDEDNAVATMVPKTGPLIEGLHVEALTPELRTKLNMKNKEVAGVVVIGVEEGSSAERSGLEEGDVITSVDRVNVTTPVQFEKAIDKKAEHVVLRVLQREVFRFVVLRK